MSWVTKTVEKPTVVEVIVCDGCSKEFDPHIDGLLRVQLEPRLDFCADCRPVLVKYTREAFRKTMSEALKAAK